MGKILRSSTFNRIRHIIKRHYEDLGICRIVILTNTESGAFVPGPLPHFNLCIFPILNPTLETTKLEDNHHSQSCRTGLMFRPKNRARHPLQVSGPIFLAVMLASSCFVRRTKIVSLDRLRIAEIKHFGVCIFPGLISAYGSSSIPVVGTHRRRTTQKSRVRMSAELPDPLLLFL